MPAFWAIPEQFLQGPALAVGIAMINALANIAGFTGPYLMGYLYQQTGSHRLGLLALATIGAALSLVLFAVRPDQAEAWQGRTARAR